MTFVRERLSQHGRTIGVGLREEQLHPHTGLRIQPFHFRLYNNDEYFVSFAGLGALIEDTANWLPVGDTPSTPIPGNVGIDPTTAQGVNLPVPCTPSVCFRNTAQTFGQQIALRVTGYDQFGAGQREVTPYITINDPGGTPTGTVNTYFWLSKVFSRITKIEYRAAGLNAAQDSIAIGFRFMLDANPASLPAQTYMNFQTGTGLLSGFALYNQGIGLPMRLRTYQSAFGGGIVQAAGKFDILGGYIENLTNSHVFAVNPFEIGTDPFLTGGFLIGMNDETAQWEKSLHKVLFTQTSGTVNYQRLDAVANATTSWGHTYQGVLYLRSTLGGGRYPLSDQYPELALARGIDE